MTVGRIKCVECDKVWADKAAYDLDPGCDRGWCQNTAESVMSRRRGRSGANRPPHIDAKPAVDRKPTIRVHVTTSQVKSKWDKNEVILEMVVPDAINTNIFVN